MAENTVSKTTDSESPQELFEGYEGGEEIPIGAYATLVGVFSSIFTLFLLLTRLTGRTLPERISPADLALLGTAAHKLS